MKYCYNPQKIVVKKFGGSSLADKEGISRAADIVARGVQAGECVVVVVSAMSDMSDAIVDLLCEVNSHCCSVEYDFAMSAGEQLSAGLFCAALTSLGLRAEPFNAMQAGIYTNNRHANADIREVTLSRVKELLEAGGIPVICGFQGADEIGRITTLGRGGSDLSAVAIACALHAQQCEIYSDVDGVYTADPNIYSHANLLQNVSYDFMCALSNSRAKVLQHKCVKYASQYEMPLLVLSSFVRCDGTCVSKRRNSEAFAIVPFNDMQIMVCKEWQVVQSLAGRRGVFLIHDVRLNEHIAHMKIENLSDGNIFLCSRDDLADVAVLPNVFLATHPPISIIDIIIDREEISEEFCRLLRRFYVDNGIDVICLFVGKSSIRLLLNGMDLLENKLFQFMREYI